MRQLLIILFSIILCTIGSSQVKLTQIQKDSVKWTLPVAHRVVPGQSGYFLKYLSLPSLFDSLGIELYDSLYVVTGASKDTIKLRDGSGYVLMDKQSQNRVRGTGTATRVAWWGGTDSLSSSSNLYWDNTNNELEVKSVPIGSNADYQFYAGLSAASGATNASFSNFLGLQAGASATNAQFSNFFGLNAGNGATNASYSNFFGYNSGFGAYGATGSNFFGLAAGNGAYGSYGSNYFGESSGVNANAAFFSNFFGLNAGNGATNARSSNFFGSSAGRDAVNADNSNFFGQDSGKETNAMSSNFFGNQSGFQATNANKSNFFGNQSGFQATNAAYSNFFGYQSAYQSASASYSNFFGYNTGSPGLGTNNILVGKSVTLPDAAANSMNIGSVLFGTGFWNSDTKNSTGSTGGKIGILTNAPAREFHVVGEVRITDLINDTPNKLLGADDDGDISSIVVGSGLSLSSGTLSSTGLGGTITNVTASTPLSSSGGTTPNITLSYNSNLGIVSSALTANFGNLYSHTYVSNFNTSVPFGWTYVNGTTNAPNATSSSWYRGKFGLGSEYPDNFMELAFPRFNHSTSGVWFRTKEGSYSSWQQLGSVTSVGVTSGTGISASVSNATTTPNITITNTGVTSLNGLGGTMYLSTGNSGTYPNWSSSGTTLYYNLPSGSSGQVLKHNGVGWTAGADNAGGATPNLTLGLKSGTDIPLIPYITSPSYAEGNTVNFRQGNGITLGRDASNVISVTASDISATNEGSLTVGAGTSTTSTISSNTSGSTAVTLEAGSALSISELGNTITLNTKPVYGDMYTGTWTASGVGNVNYTSSNVNSNITVSTGSDYLQVYESGVYEVCLEATVGITSGEYFLLYTNMSGTGPYIDLDTGGTLQQGTYRSCVFKNLTSDTIYTEYNSNGAAVTRVSISAKRIN